MNREDEKDNSLSWINFH